MAWTAPRTWNIGELVTKAIMDTFIRDNQVYLKAETDKLNLITASEPAYALDNNYQNATGKIKFVAVTVTLQNSEEVYFLTDAATPPTNIIARFAFMNAAAGEWINATIYGFVQLTHYYKVSSAAGTPTLLEWHEWDLH